MEDGLGKVDRCLGTSFWSRFGELGGNGRDMGDIGSWAADHQLCIWKWVAGELGRQSGRGRGGSGEKPVVKCGFLY